MNMEEEATGIIQHGKLGAFYDKRGIAMPMEEARAVIKMGETIEVPNAGAGSYHAVFRELGYDEVKVINWSSSVGDWQFGVRDADGWAIAYQENRWPRHGFEYGVDTSAMFSGYDTFEKVCRALEEMQ